MDMQGECNEKRGGRGQGVAADAWGEQMLVKEPKQG